MGCNFLKSNGNASWGFQTEAYPQDAAYSISVNALRSEKR